MRSPDAGTRRLLFGKERRELASSRAWLVLLVLLGPLVGHAFITAVESYASLSGGAPAPVQPVTAFGAIVVPTFRAYTIAVTVFFPFVAIRLVSPEKQSGALKLLLQARPSLGTMLVVKLIVLVAAWLVAWLPGLAAFALWRGYGGPLAAPGVAAMLTGNLLRATLIAAVAIAAAAVTDNAAAAAIVTLALTLGTWTLDFFAQVRGSLALDGDTPASALRIYERGELPLALVLVTVVLTLGALLIAWLWLPPCRTRRQRTLGTLPIVTAGALLVFGATQLRQSWKLSDDWSSSFTTAEERFESRAPQPVQMGASLNREESRPPAVLPLEAALIFYVVWPLLVIVPWWLTRQPRRAKRSPVGG